MDSMTSDVGTFLGLASIIFIFVVGIGVLGILIVFLADILQTKDAIRRNYPVVGHLRYIFEELGVFFRQYFFAMDREELPFNRAQREWVYRAARDGDSTIAFGSTKDLRPLNTAFFVNCPFPTLEDEAVQTTPVTLGDNCRHPFTTDKILNISAMSYGALSKVAVQALSHGAAQAGCWLNTGEGGISPFHLEGKCDLVFQIGIANYGVRNQDGSLSEEKLAEVARIPQVRMFEIKLSQGAKPGKGGYYRRTKSPVKLQKPEVFRRVRPPSALIAIRKSTTRPNCWIVLRMCGRSRESRSDLRVLSAPMVGLKHSSRKFTAAVWSRRLILLPSIVPMAGPARPR